MYWNLNTTVGIEVSKRTSWKMT